MLEPLLEHFSNLSSGNFCHELNAWKETVEVGLQRAELISIKTEECVDANDENEGDSILDPADAMETAGLMDALESADRECFTDQSSDDDEVPPTQQAEMHQELPLQGGTPDASTESATQAKLRKTKGGEDEIREAPLTAEAVTASCITLKSDAWPKPMLIRQPRFMCSCKKSLSRLIESSQPVNTRTSYCQRFRVFIAISSSTSKDNMLP
ncbi:hypothetical protein JG687_00007956 [Phytophthora cactorum]|uniref:Uncharacterized protein n=1 Tax=Phytophthora cactorum TaxID=29920 RepID=A0A8T1UDR2_9STRA|nr:hypothetical protein JG687_00007956 [Phytophthora cactorum]